MTKVLSSVKNDCGKDARPQATKGLEFLSLRASVAWRGNPVKMSAERRTHHLNFELCTLNFEKTRWGRVFYLLSGGILILLLLARI